MGSERKELHRECRGQWAENEPPIVEFNIAENEASSAANGIERSLMGAVRGERVVMAIQNHDCPSRDHRLHSGSLLCIGAYGDESLPMSKFR
jgi:hypothetical protein